jgi:hypothetical protein
MYNACHFEPSPCHFEREREIFLLFIISGSSCDLIAGSSKDFSVAKAPVRKHTSLCLLSFTTPSSAALQ